MKKIILPAIFSIFLLTISACNEEDAQIKIYNNTNMTIISFELTGDNETDNILGNNLETGEEKILSSKVESGYYYWKIKFDSSSSMMQECSSNSDIELFPGINTVLLSAGSKHDQCQ